MAPPSPGRASSTALPAQAPSAVHPGYLAAEQVFAPLAQGEAPRIGVLGKSGTGKTELAKRLVDEYLRRSRGVVVVVDDKELRPRYRGQCYRDRAELARRPPEPEPRIIVLRGAPAELEGVDHEDAAQLQQGFAARGRPSIMVHDEMCDAAAYGQWLAGRDSLIKRQFVKGRAVGIGKIWLAQLPEYVPDEPWKGSSAICAFYVDDGTMGRLRRFGWVDARLEKTIRALPQGDGPPSARGYFVVLLPECRSDGKIYRYGS